MGPVRPPPPNADLATLTATHDAAVAALEDLCRAIRARMRRAVAQRDFVSRTTDEATAHANELLRAVGLPDLPSEPAG